MTNETVFNIDIKEVEEFLEGTGYPPLTEFERGKLHIAFAEDEAHALDLVCEVVRLRDDCHVACEGPANVIEDAEQSDVMPSVN